MLIAHAIVAPPRVAIDRAGLRDQPLRWSEADGLALWSTDWAAGDSVARGDALEHHAVVSAIHRAQPCLPVRFGTAFADEDAARASLAAKSAQLRTTLDRVRGKSELALTLLWRGDASAEAVAADTPGRRFMEERRARYRASAGRRARAEAIASRLLAELPFDRPLVWHETCTSEAVAVSLAVLVPTEQASSWRGRLEASVAGHPEVRPVMSGPWPPYTFAGQA